MRRTILRLFAWVAAASWLYGALLLLDVYWNIVTWQPSWDWTAAALCGSVFLGLALIWTLTHSSCAPVDRAVGAGVGLAFLLVALYVLPAEPLSQGLFARKMASPIWYRVFRLLIMLGPICFWIAHRAAVPNLPEPGPGPGPVDVSPSSPDASST